MCVCFRLRAYSYFTAQESLLAVFGDPFLSLGIELGLTMCKGSGLIGSISLILQEIAFWGQSCSFASRALA